MAIKDFGLAGDLVVAQQEGRRFPGLLIQGDTLLSLLEDLRDEAPQSVAAARVSEWLGDYEEALDSLGQPLPYPDGARVAK